MQADQLAVSMWSVHRKYYHDGWSVFDFLNFADEAGIRSLELLNNFWRDEENELPKLQEELLRRGMAVAAWAVSNDFARAEYDAQVDEILHGIEVAQRLHTRTVRVFAAHPRQGIDLDQVLHTVVRGLKAVAPQAQSAGVTLAIENHGLLAGKSDQILAIIRDVDSPFVRANTDIGNFLLVDEDPLQAVRKLMAYIAHVHVKDMVPATEGGFPSLAGQHYRGGAVGEGVVPVGDIMAELNAAGYRGYLSLEFEGEGDEPTGIRQSMTTLHQLLPTS